MITTAQGLATVALSGAEHFAVRAAPRCCFPVMLFSAERRAERRV